MTDVDTRTRPTMPTATEAATKAPSRAGVEVRTPGPMLTKIYDFAALNAQPPMLVIGVRKPTVEELKKTPSWSMFGHLCAYAVNGVLSIVVLLVFLALWTVCHVVLWLVGHPKRFAAGLAVAAVAAIYLTYR